MKNKNPINSQLGFFDDSAREYAIERMFPAKRLVNYLWNEQYIAGIDQFGGGAGRWKDESGDFVPCVREGESRVLFLRDRATGDFWSPNRNFGREAWPRFRTRVGMGYSVIEATAHGLASSLTLFVPRQDPVECWEFTVRNLEDKPRSLSLFAYADFNMLWSWQWECATSAYDKELGGMLLLHPSFNMIVRTKLTAAWFAADAPASAWESTNRRFIGLYGTIHAPDAVRDGRLSSTATVFDELMTGALQFDIDLAPDESRTLRFAVGLAQDANAARILARRAVSAAFQQAERSALRAAQEDMIVKYECALPHAECQSLVNIWLKRQVSLGKTWGRVYGKGFRDVLQDVTAFAPLDPELASQKIALVLRHQFPSGNGLRQFEPTSKAPYRDAAAWIPTAVAAYLKESGDFSFLDEKIPYYDSDETGSVADHCLRGLGFLFGERGAHGLPLLGLGDWNDALNAAGIEGRGEGVWLAMAAVKAARDFAPILQRIGREEQAEHWLREAEQLCRSILQHGWDKDHFIYAINDWGEKIGAWENTEGRFFLNTQTWAVLAAVVDQAQGHTLMDAVEQYLATPYGYRQLTPSYSRPDPHIGRLTYCQPGTYENGSIYNHGVTFKIAADCALGRGRRAFDTVLRMLTSNPANPGMHSSMEPYAIANMYLGPECELRAGETIYSWVTGSGSWLYRCLTEFILGVQADYDGLRIHPCLPPEWREARVRRLYRGAVYDIELRNPSGIESGLVDLVVNGKPHRGDVAPVFPAGTAHRIEATLRSRPG